MFFSTRHWQIEGCSIAFNRKCFWGLGLRASPRREAFFLTNGTLLLSFLFCRGGKLGGA